MANEIVEGVPYLRIEADYGDEVIVQVDPVNNQIRIKLDTEEGEFSSFIDPADAVALAYFILKSVNN